MKYGECWTCKKFTTRCTAKPGTCSVENPKPSPKPESARGNARKEALEIARAYKKNTIEEYMMDTENTIMTAADMMLAAMKDLRDGKIDSEKAKALAQCGATIVQMAKAETDAVLAYKAIPVRSIFGSTRTAPQLEDNR